MLFSAASVTLFRGLPIDNLKRRLKDSSKFLSQIGLQYNDNGQLVLNDDSKAGIAQAPLFGQTLLQSLISEYEFLGSTLHHLAAHT